MSTLLDVDVLVALAWPNHVHHGTARRWFDARSASGWATTPMTEAGFVRISSNRQALPTSTTPALAIELLRAMTVLEGHEFWVDDVSWTNRRRLPRSAVTVRSLTSTCWRSPDAGRVAWRRSTAGSSLWETRRSST